MDAEAKQRLARTLKWTTLVLGVVGLVGMVVLIVGYYRLKGQVPNIRTLADYRPAQATKLYSDDGHLVASLAHERRTVIAVENLPQHVVRAFLAAEDSGFYEHAGLDYFGILRAAIKNLRPGAHLQGASTITQQTVKTMVLGPERSYNRKMREAILARQLEQMLTKEGILHLYLNQIYFGWGAYGVEEAAQLYFGKSARDLDLGEAAYLAAVPKSPARYNIKSHPAAAKQRQTYVLERMAALGWADAQAAEREVKEPVPTPAPSPPFLRKTPHYVEHVRRLLIEHYGEERVYEGGLTVYTGMNAEAQIAAQRALRSGLEDLARRHGWDGASLRIEVDRLERYSEALHEELEQELAHISAYEGTGFSSHRWVWDLSRLEAQDLVDEKRVAEALDAVLIEKGERTTALVQAVDSVEDVVWVDLGTLRGKISLSSMQWARRFSPVQHTPPPRDVSDVLNKGDIITVELVDIPDELPKDESEPVVIVELVPEPKAEGAVVSIDPHTRYVRALVGGYEQERGNLIRAVQSRRQPGSAFKPIVYTTGIDSGAITPASICADTPIVIRDPWTGKAWKPQNYEDGKYDGDITYRTALMRSKNICSVKLVEKVGPEKVIEMAHAMGIHSELPQNLTLALGTGDVTPLELCNAYATIAAEGMVAEPIFIRKVVAPDGQILEETQAQPEQVLRPEVAYVVSQMMRSVVEGGTATRALVLDRPLAGKTGTSNESRNVWFGGFSRELVAVIWVGFDDNSPLGRATGSSTALPIWIRYMGRALEGVPQRDFEPPEGIASVRVDPRTGQPSNAAHAIDEVFIEGTEPDADTAPLPSIFIEDDPSRRRMAGP